MKLSSCATSLSLICTLAAGCHRYADTGIATIRRNEADFRPCLQDAAARNPNIRGSVALEFQVDPNGKVAAVTVVSNDFSDQLLVNCVQAKAQAFSFPPPDNQKSEKFRFKFSVDR